MKQSAIGGFDAKDWITGRAVASSTLWESDERFASEPGRPCSNGCFGEQPLSLVCRFLPDAALLPADAPVKQCGTDSGLMLGELARPC